MRIQEASEQAKQATAWAAGTLTLHGATLYAVEGGAWDVELKDGSWRAAENYRELCEVAREVLRVASDEAIEHAEWREAAEANRRAEGAWEDAGACCK